MSQLRGTQVTECNKRLKVFLYGESGCGKSYFCTQFPKTYYIDCEGRIKRQIYADHLNKNDSCVFQTDKFSELMLEIKALASVKHDYQTLVIDSITPIYTKLVDECHVNLMKLNRKLRFSEEYLEANKKFKKLMDLLRVIDMNVIVTAHSKCKWEDDKATGTTFDAYKKFDYYFEVVMEAKLEHDAKKNNYDYKANIKKSTIISLPPNHAINFSYDEFKHLYDKELKTFSPKPVMQPKVDAVQIVKKDNVVSLPEEPKCSELMSKQLRFLISHCEIPEATVGAWYKKAGINDIGSFTEKQATSLIAMIETDNVGAKQAWDDILKARESYNESLRG